MSNPNQIYDDIAAEFNTLRSLTAVARDIAFEFPPSEEEADPAIERLEAILIALHDRLEMVEQKFEARRPRMGGEAT
jgi:hypothetical protein